MAYRKIQTTNYILFIVLKYDYIVNAGGCHRLLKGEEVDGETAYLKLIELSINFPVSCY